MECSTYVLSTFCVRGSRTCALLPPARLEYSGSTCSSLMLSRAQASRTSSSRVAAANRLRKSEPSLATFMIHGAVTIFVVSSSGEQEWSPASAGHIARSRQVPARPPGSTALAQAFISWCPPVAASQAWSNTARRCGVSCSSAAALMSRCSGSVQAPRSRPPASEATICLGLRSRGRAGMTDVLRGEDLWDEARLPQALPWCNRGVTWQPGGEMLEIHTSGRLAELLRSLPTHLIYAPRPDPGLPE